LIPATLLLLLLLRGLGLLVVMHLLLSHGQLDSLHDLQRLQHLAAAAAAAARS
jgi:hypothetical protein